MVRYLFFALICTIAISFPMAGFSQDENMGITQEKMEFAQEEDLPGDKNVRYGYGTVIEVKKDSNELVVSEHDWESGEEGEVTYSIDADVIIENMDSWENLPNGTYIDTEYTTDENGKRILSYVNVYETEVSEPEME